MPAGIGISAASCSTGGTIDAVSHTVTVTSGSSVTCTITVLDAVKYTTALITTLSTMRSQLVLSTEPNLQPFSLWLEGKYAGFDATGGSGTYGVLQGGADGLLSPNLLAGVGVALDWIGLDASSGTGRADGLGVLIGPYLTATTDSSLYFDARAAWGYSSNRFDPYGLYEDQTGGRRALVTAALGGTFAFGGAEIRPGGSTLLVP